MDPVFHAAIDGGPFFGLSYGLYSACMSSSFKFCHRDIVYYFMREKSTLFGNSGKLTAAALINKLLGYLRDAMVVWIFGSTRITDAYYAVLRFITFFRRAFGEGAVNAALLPEFFGSRAPERDFNAFFSALLAFITLTSFVLSALLIIFRKTVILAVSGGFASDPWQFKIAATILGIMAFHIVFLGVYALFQGFLNFKNRFFKPAISQAFFSLAIITALLLFRKSDPERAIYAVALTALLSGFFQVLFLLKDVKKEGMRLSLKNPFRRDVFSIFSSSLRSAFCLSQDYILLFISMAFGSFLREGTVTAFYNSSRLIQFPLSLIASSIALAALKETASDYSSGNREAFKKNFTASFRLNFAILAPSAAGLFLLAQPISEFLFSHGRFSREDALYTAGILKILALAVPFLGLNKLFVSLLSSMGRQREAQRPVLISIIFHFSLSWLLADCGAAGTAFSAVAASALSCLIFSFLAARHSGTNLREQSFFILKVLLSVLAMSAVTLVLLKFSGAHAAKAALAIIGAAVFAYFGCLKILRIDIRRLED